MEVGRVAPAFDFHFGHFAGFEEFGDPRTGFAHRHAVVIGEIGGGGDAGGAGGLSQQLTLGGFWVDFAFAVFGGEDAFGEVEGAGEVGAAVGDGEEAAAEVGLEDGAGDGDPGAGHTAVFALGFGEFFSADGAAGPDLIEDPGDVFGKAGHDLFEAVGADAVGVHAVAEEGPGLDGEDGGFVGPVFGEFAAAVDEVVEVGFRVGAEAGEEDVVVGGAEDVDVVDLQEAETADRAADVGEGDGGGARPGEALGGEGDATGFGEGEGGAGHERYLEGGEGWVMERSRLYRVMLWGNYMDHCESPSRSVATT